MTNIVWSKNGILAYARGQTVYFTWPRCTDGASWELMDPVEINVGRQVAFLSFGPNMNLAVVDETGRIEIIEILADGKYKTKCSWLSVSDPRPRPTELDKIVGIYWLNDDKNLGLPTVVPPYQKAQQGAPPPNLKCQWDSVKPHGPLHPAQGKACLLAVTGNGMLRLVVELAEGFREVSVALPSALTISAVSFCPQVPDSLLIAVYSDSSVLLFKLQVTFNPKLMERSPPKDILTATVVPLAAAAVTEPLVGDLRVFELIKSPLMPQNRPIIHAIFTSQTSSQVLIFKMFPRTEKLHPVLQQMAPTPQSGKEEHLKLSLSDSRTTSKAIKSYFMAKTVILIIYMDNSIESQNLLPKTDMVLPGKHFSFDLESTDEICFSPNFCIAAQLPAEGIPKLSQLKITDLSPQTVHELATLIATSYAFSVFNYIQCDDLLQAVWHWSNVDAPKQNIRASAFNSVVISEAQRLLNVPIDPSDDPQQVDKFIVIPSSLQCWLMLQMFLGTTKGWKRTPPSLLAWSGLHIQYIAFVVKFTLRRMAPKQGEQLTPEQQMAHITISCYNINGMIGLVRWFTDFISHINREIFLATVQPGATENTADPRQDPSVLYLSKNPGTFINVILSKVMRWLIMFVMRGLRGIETLLNHLVQQEKMLNQNFGTAFFTLKKLTGILTTAPVPLAAFEKVLGEIDSEFKTVLYRNEKIHERVKQVLEVELLKNNTTPVPLLRHISHTIRLFKSQLVGKLNVPNLYFYETSWLQIDEHNKPQRDKVDVIKSFVINSNQTLRKCTRCNQVSAIETPKQAQLNQVGSLFSKSCLCGGLWKSTQRSQE